MRTRCSSKSATIGGHSWVADVPRLYAITRVVLMKSPCVTCGAKAERSPLCDTCWIEYQALHAQARLDLIRMREENLSTDWLDIGETV